ncbi:Alg9-like mannosyltransferase family-domain-containing protein [Trametes punicea]|nr:Alg9-like mannosyltransferase family-domain-containing protein [Trametes punicea]
MPEASSQSRLLRYAYIGLVITRVCFALLGTGYIHPDEYFQNGEAAAGRALGLSSVLTWEWDPVFPCRSIIPVWLSTGVPFSILRFFVKGHVPGPRLIFSVERVSFLLSSFLLDYSIHSLVHESVRLQALLLFASSYVVHTYQVRPFSNSIEAILVALSLVTLKRLFLVESDKAASRRAPLNLALLAFVAVCGLFTRITFAAFCLPIALEVLKWSLRKALFSLNAISRLLSPPLLVAAITALVFVYADTLYYHGTVHLSRIELTPLNFLRYNLLPSNLAEHGLHPRWLHLVVNLPMIATPGLLYYVLRAEFDIFTSRSRNEDKSKPGVVELMQRTCYWIRWSATSLLSIQPHQEPRFLTPLLVPMIAMAVNNARILRAGRTFVTFWVVTNAALAILFGILHQGGVVPSLFHVHDVVYGDASGMASHDFRIVYWKTYMPPRHLLAIPQVDVDSQRVSVHDLSGASPSSVIDTLISSSRHLRPLLTLLVTPFHAVRKLHEQVPGCIKERERVFPHLDLDHIPESVQVGWRDGLGLGIFDVDVACVRKAMLTLGDQEVETMVLQ